MTLNKGTPSASQAVRNGEGGAVRDGAMDQRGTGAVRGEGWGR